MATTPGIELAERRVPCDAADAFAPSFRHFDDDLHLNAAGAAHMAEVLAPCVAAALRRK